MSIKLKAKVITVNQQKGGSGKSTLTKNLTTYLAVDRGKKVLNIDGDYSLYLSANLYGIYESKGTVGELYKLEEDQAPESIIYHSVHPNIDLISGDPHLNEKQKKLTTEEGTSFILMKWLFKNQEKLKEYDYIIIDTHNDFDIFTKSAVTISDVILAPLDPSEGNDAIITRMDYELNKLKNQLVEPYSNESYINADLYVIGNKIAKNINSHRNFLDELQHKDNYLTWIPQKELFVKASKNIKSMKTMIEQDRGNHKIFYKQYLDAMHKIEEIINK